MNKKQIEDSLKLQSVCPKCGADWEQIEEMRHAPSFSEDRQLAHLIIKNCGVCQMRFKNESNF